MIPSSSAASKAAFGGAPAVETHVVHAIVLYDGELTKPVGLIGGGIAGKGPYGAVERAPEMTVDAVDSYMVFAPGNFTHAEASAAGVGTGIAVKSGRDGVKSRVELVPEADVLAKVDHDGEDRVASGGFDGFCGDFIAVGTRYFDG